MSTVRSVLAIMAFTAVTVGVRPPPATAQDVRYTTVSKVELGGSLGRVLRLVSGFGDPMRETVSITRTRMLTETDANATIMNADDGTITFVDHEGQSYWTMNLAEMLQGMSGAMAGAVAEADVEPPAEEDARDQPASGDSVHYEVHVSTDRTGRRERVAGYEAEQVFLTVQIEGEAYAEEGDSTVKGSVFVLSELWLSEDFPGHEAEQAFHRAWAEKVAAGFAFDTADARDMDAVYAHDPRLREALEGMEEQMEELRGSPLRSVSHFVTVPDGVEFDREAVLRDADKSLGDDVVGAAARGVVGGARRRLGGMLRRGNRNREPQPQQAVIMRITTEIENPELGPLAPELFVPPADYTMRESPMPVRPGSTPG